MEYEDRYKEMFIKSLTEDIDSWTANHYGAAGYSWTEYLSKEYGSREENNRIQFCVDNLNFGACVYINGCVQIRYPVYPFSKLKKSIKNMKKYIKNNSKINKDKILENIIRSNTDKSAANDLIDKIQRLKSNN